MANKVTSLFNETGSNLVTNKCNYRKNQHRREKNIYFSRKKLHHCFGILFLLLKLIATKTSFIVEAFVLPSRTSDNTFFTQKTTTFNYKRSSSVTNSCRQKTHVIDHHKLLSPLFLQSRTENDDIQTSIKMLNDEDGIEKSNDNEYLSFLPGQGDTNTKADQTRSYDDFGPLLPIAEKLDTITGKWALSYADLTPATPTTPAGIAFLATNAFYAMAGLGLAIRGDFFFGALTEIAGIVSFWYHYSQLKFGQDRSEVRLALLVDYFTAGCALITGGFYMAQMGVEVIPFDALCLGAISVGCLSLSWVWEFGYSYLFWHSLWHVTSAYTGYMVGQAHLTFTA